MRKIAFIIVLALLVQSIASAQSCLPDGIRFTTQEQIDNFQTNYPNCTEIEGGILIGEEFISNNITNLDGLIVLTSIGEGLYIEMSAALTNFAGLDNVTLIGGDLWINSNYTLTSLTGLDNLTSIGGSLGIDNCIKLTGLTGLDNLTSIGGSLWIGYNYALTDLTSLENMASIGGDLQLLSNDSLTSLTGLESLISIGGRLVIDGEVAGGNNALTSLTGLNNVTSIGGDLDIRSNDVLTSIASLYNIDAGSITNLSLTNNLSLATCEVQSICEYLASPSGTIEIHDNATGCNSQEEVEEACGITSVENLTNDEIFTIYPNPSSSHITIELPNTPQKNAVIAIYNINAQQMLTSKITAQKTVVDVSGLSPGFYFIEVADNRSIMVATGKMLLMK